VSALSTGADLLNLDEAQDRGAPGVAIDGAGTLMAFFYESPV